jgi:hypothetical protein
MFERCIPCLKMNIDSGELPSIFCDLRFRCMGFRSAFQPLTREREYDYHDATIPVSAVLWKLSHSVPERTAHFSGVSDAFRSKRSQ